MPDVPVRLFSGRHPEHDYMHFQYAIERTRKLHQPTGLLEEQRACERDE